MTSDETTTSSSSTSMVPSFQVPDVMKEPAKVLSKPLLIVLSCIFSTFGVVLYSTTYLGLSDDIADFFGTRHDEHYQRTVGRGVKVLTYYVDVILFIHYFIETFWFHALYYSVMVPIFLLLVVQAVNSILLIRQKRKTRIAQTSG